MMQKLKELAYLNIEDSEIKAELSLNSLKMCISRELAIFLISRPSKNILYNLPNGFEGGGGDWIQAENESKSDQNTIRFHIIFG